MKHIKLFESVNLSNFDQIEKAIEDSKSLLEVLWDIGVSEYLRLCDIPKNTQFYAQLQHNIGAIPGCKDKTYIRRLTVTDYSIDDQNLNITLTYYGEYGSNEETNYHLEIDKERIDILLSSKKFGL